MSDHADPSHAFLRELRERGLLHQVTNEAGLAKRLDEGLVVYCGFDPTKNSLTIGNFVAVTLLRRFQLAGQRPIVVMGGGTGMIGDPSGKDAERTLLDRAQIAANVAGQRVIFERLLDFEGPHAATIVDNADWLTGLGYIEMLRDVGKHFSVNMMIQKDSVKARLEGREHGISYTEFSYMILQAYDFAHLAKSRQVALQIGGSDQWGNIVAGVDLARRLHQLEVFGLTAPLLVKSDGGKFGKTESGAVWLTSDYTSPYAFYQFWMNAADQDVANFLRVFSFRSLPEIEALLTEHAADPSKRSAQKALAEELTELLHGSEGLRDARLATEALFSGDVRSLSEHLLDEAFAGAPSTSVPRASLEAGTLPLADALVLAQIVKSKREAREFLKSGAVSVNGEKRGEEHVLSSADLLFGRVVLVRRGKKTWHVLRVQD